MDVVCVYVLSSKLRDLPLFEERFEVLSPARLLDVGETHHQMPTLLGYPLMVIHLIGWNDAFGHTPLGVRTTVEAGRVSHSYRWVRCVWCGVIYACVRTSKSISGCLEYSHAGGMCNIHLATWNQQHFYQSVIIGDYRQQLLLYHGSIILPCEKQHGLYKASTWLGSCIAGGRDSW